MARFTNQASEAADHGAVSVQERRAPARAEVLQRQREEYGGLHWGSAFFGWLAAVGVATLLVGLIAATGAAVGLTSSSDASSTVGIVGGALLLAALMIAYYCGGYVAGRMARFYGPKQGLAVWLIGLAVTIVLAVAGVLFGAKYNVLSGLNLPRIPIDEGSLTTGGLIALAAVLVGTLLAAVAGGKAGTHFHRKVDRVGQA
jgi:MFS family permease